jgi:hypothetical protein
MRWYSFVGLDSPENIVSRKLEPVNEKIIFDINSTELSPPIYNHNTQHGRVFALTVPPMQLQLVFASGQILLLRHDQPDLRPRCLWAKEAIAGQNHLEALQLHCQQ